LNLISSKSNASVSNEIVSSVSIVFIETLLLEKLLEVVSEGISVCFGVAFDCFFAASLDTFASSLAICDADSTAFASAFFVLCFRARHRSQLSLSIF
jgi:hypothetical protein